MPILRGHDSKGLYYKVYRTKTKFQYLPNNEISRKITHQIYILLSWDILIAANIFLAFV